MNGPVTVDITAIAAGGDGVARHDGMVVFVPRTAPGDRVRVRLQVKGRFARGSVLGVESPSPDRVEPACPHYTTDRCGGCQLQHLGLDAQRAAKAQIIQDAFARIGKRTVELPTVRGAGEPWRYRRKLTVALRWMGNAWRTGLHKSGAPDEIFALADCHITDPRVVEAVHAILRQGGALLPRAEQLRLAVRLAGDELHAVVEGGTDWKKQQAFADAVPELAAIWWIDDDNRRRLIFDRRAAAVPGASFVQVNAAVSAAMADRVHELVTSLAPRTVVDGYAGSGEGAARLAATGVTVTAIELDAEASAHAGRLLRAPSQALCGTVEALLPGALPADVVILNPPRSGVAPEVTAALAGLSGDARPKAIVYVSCDPATLARDVGRLPGWQVKSLEGFDMFPQTAHVETVCLLVPEGA